MAKRWQRKKGARDHAQVGSNPAAFPFAPGALACTWQAWLPRLLLIAGATLWIYWPALRGDFVWDDGWYITTNPLLHNLTGLWKFWFQPGSWVEYYPIQETVLWTQWQLWGNDTLGYHLTSLILHIINALLVWHLLSKFGLRLAWLGGLLFAVHPAQVESVAWISEMKNTLSLPFFLLSMSAWIDYEEHKQKRDYQWALGLFLIAMLCKITMAPFPAIILLYAWWKRGRIQWTDLKASAPFFVVSLALGITAIVVGNLYGQNGHAQDLNIPLGDFFTRFARAGMILAYYFANCFLPIDPSPVYPKWPTHPGAVVSYLPWLAFGGAVAWLWKKRHGWGRHVLLGLGFFGINLVPFLGFHAISYMLYSWVENRLLYLPLIGLIGIVVAGLGNLDGKLPPSFRPCAIGVMTLAVFLMASGARAYAGWFLNEETLWTRTLQRDPNAWLAHHDLGCRFIEKEQFPEAITQLREAVLLKPDFDQAHYNLGIALDKTGRSPEAQEQYRETLRLNPDNAKAYLNLGEIMRRDGNLAEAEALFRRGLKSAPDDASLCADLGGILLQKGGISEAIDLYEHALEFDPDVAQLQYNLGVALLQTGSLSAAAEHLEKAVTLDPKIAAAHENLGVAMARLGRLPEAIEQFEAVLQIDPNLGDTRDNLGLALAQTGHIPEAVEQFRQALQINPGDNKARESLAKLQVLPAGFPAKP